MAPPPQPCPPAVPPADRPSSHAPLPRLARAVLRALLPPAERDELLADLSAEHAERAARDGRGPAGRWLWRQTVRSAPALLGWSWWRGWTGFEPRANVYRPGGFMLAHWTADARYAVRRLRARPLYTLLAVLTLALGVGGVAAVFGIARPLLFEPLPFAHAREVGTFWMGGSWTEEEFLHLRGTFPGFRQVAAHRSGDVTLRDRNGPARLIPGIGTSAELFDVLGARPLLGRTFRAGDDALGAEPVTVLSYGLWQELGGDPSIVGSRLTLDGAPRTVVGVMPRGFWYPDPSVRIWNARALDPEHRDGNWTLVGRVAPGQDVARMDESVRRLTGMLGERFEYGPQWDKTKDAHITPLREQLVGSMRPALLATLAAMGLILLIACANVAALMLGQVEGRATEIAVRSALGAGRRRLTQQLVIEALLIGLAAGLAGASLAALGFGVLARALPVGAWAESARFDVATFAMAIGAATAAVLLVVLAPASALWRGDIRGALSRARTGGIEGRGGRMERGLVVAEVALAMLIASGAALLVRSVTNLYAIDPGIQPAGVAVIDVVASADLSPQERGQTIMRALAALGELPGVRAVAASSKLPLRGSGDNSGFTVEGRPELERTTTAVRVVTKDYFQAMGFRLRAGELPDGPMRPDSTLMVVVNEALGRKFFPAENALGRRVGSGGPAFREIVAVVGDAAEATLTDEPVPTRYFVTRGTAWGSDRAALVIRTARPGDAEGLLDAARRTVQRVAPGLAVQETTTMQRIFDTAVGPARQVMSLLALLAALALVLGAVGIYGVIAHFAARRQRDWAIRVALGLPGGRVVRHIVGQGATLVGIGIAVGAVGTVALARFLASLLFGVSAVDPVAFAAASAALLVVGVAAAFVPARRAGNTDPALVLRES